MKRTEITFDMESVPLSIKPYLKGATIYDSSCSETAKTLLVSGAERAFLKISQRGTLDREYCMTEFLHKHQAAPKAIAYESDLENDYLLLEAVNGEDGTAEMHLENPDQLACVFGEYLYMLHSMPIEGCPYNDRSKEMLHDAAARGIDLRELNESGYSAIDNVIIHGDYCLPNIIMDRFTFRGFIDLGSGGIGDRHYDLYWGLWTLQYNLKTDKYGPMFFDAYGRNHIDEDGLHYFTRLIQLTD